MLRGVIFDFDGVLVDSERAHFLGVQRVLMEEAGFEITFEEYADHYLAYEDRGCLRRALERHGQNPTLAFVEELAVRKKKIFADLLPSIPFLPGAKDLIIALDDAGVPLAIASGARRHEIEVLLRAQNLLEFFRGIVSADDVENFKPHPEPYLRARTLVDAIHSADGIVAFEDSTPGMASARAAGLRVIGVSNSQPKEKLVLAHRVVDSLVELTVEDIAELSEAQI